MGLFRPYKDEKNCPLVEGCGRKLTVCLTLWVAEEETSRNQTSKIVPCVGVLQSFLLTIAEGSHSQKINIKII